MAVWYGLEKVVNILLARGATVEAQADDSYKVREAGLI